jgi:probable rRNA maturation factor
MTTSSAPPSGAAASPYEIDVEIEEAYQTVVAPELLVEAVTATLSHVGLPQAGLTVVVTSDEAIQALNAQYREVDAPTDVLSFASQEESVVGQNLVLPPELAAELARYLGDIVIAYPYATRQAAQYQNSIQDELRLLAVHGTLHLLGYDHDTLEAEGEMWELQDAVLAHLGIQSPAHRHYE